MIAESQFYDFAAITGFINEISWITGYFYSIKLPQFLQFNSTFSEWKHEEYFSYFTGIHSVKI